MKKTLITLAVATVFGVSVNAHAVSAPAAEASIDWSQFTIKLIDLDPLDSVTSSLTWTSQNSASQYSEARAVNSPSWSSEDWDYANDWSTHISAMLSPANASADGSTLTAWVDSGSGYGYAAARRWGAFTLSANTLVLFSAPAMVAVAGGDYASAYMSTIGVGAYGAGNQSAYSNIYAGAGASSTDSATLTASFVNLTSGDLRGHFQAAAHASAPVPESETYAMMLAGLALVGWMARRRKA